MTASDCVHATMIQLAPFPGFSIERCTWECEELFVEILRPNGITVHFLLEDVVLAAISRPPFNGKDEPDEIATLRDQVDHLRHESERRRQDLGAHLRALLDAKRENKVLRDEYTRLREALEKIASLGVAFDAKGTRSREVWEIASGALEFTEESET